MVNYEYYRKQLTTDAAKQSSTLFGTVRQHSVLLTFWEKQCPIITRTKNADKSRSIFIKLLVLQNKLINCRCMQFYRPQCLLAVTVFVNKEFIYQSVTLITNTNCFIVTALII